VAGGILGGLGFELTGQFEDCEDPAVPDTEPASQDAPPVAVRARSLGLDGPRGPVYDDVDLSAPAGTLLVVSGPAGTGRTSLLLTLAGRMRATRGEAEVAGHALPPERGAVQRQVVLATVRGVNDLDGELTVEEHVLERLALAAPWWRLLTPSPRDVPAVLAAVDDDEHPPVEPAALVRDVSAYDRFRLGVALALADRARLHPRVLVADDVDDLRDPHAVTAAWRLLGVLAGSDDGPVPGGLTVLASCSAPSSLPADVRTDPRTLLHPLTTRRPAPSTATPAADPDDAKDEAHR